MHFSYVCKHKHKPTNYYMKKLTLTCLAFIAMATANIQTAFAQQEDSLLLTIGCLTDFHVEGQYLNYAHPGQTQGVRLRTASIIAIDSMKKENVDMLLLGGDYTSLTTVDQANWKAAQKMLVDSLRGVFGDREYKPVVYVTGNHEFQAPGDAGNKWYKTAAGSTKSWNSGDYYTFPMKTDIGVLSTSDAYYERSGTMRLLGAFYYNILGVDVVGLNTASCFFGNASSYSYTSGAAKWCISKIDALYKEDPNRTVFFIVHVPFNDSNSLSSGKGMKGEGTVPDVLKKGLAKHPNLIMLYGHDHGGDNAMTHNKTSQRITRYDSNGNKIATNDSTHVDGTQIGDIFIPASDSVFTPYTCLVNLGNGKYLGRDQDDQGNDANYLNIMTTPGQATLSTYSVSFTQSGTKYYLQSNTSGNFSAKTTSATTYIYEVADSLLDADTITVSRSASVQEGHYYIITQSGFVLGNAKNTDSESRRVTGFKPSGYAEGAATVTLAQANNKNYIYKYDKVTERPSIDLTTGKEAFLSAFMGSLRFHTDSFNPNGDYEDSFDKEPKVIQGLIIKLYKDRIEFRMKNYGYYGTQNGITIEKELAPYTIFRNVNLHETNQTVIEAVKAESGNGKTYNMQGMEVGPDYKGIVIKNGVKTLNR